MRRLTTLVLAVGLLAICTLTSSVAHASRNAKSTKLDSLDRIVYLFPELAKSSQYKGLIPDASKRLERARRYLRAK